MQEKLLTAAVGLFNTMLGVSENLHSETCIQKALVSEKTTVVLTNSQNAIKMLWFNLKTVMCKQGLNQL